MVLGGLAQMTDAPAGGNADRVFISYAHDDDAHVDRVRDFWLFLRSQGIDADLDLPAAEQRLDWTEWMTTQIRDARFVLVVASPQYKRRAEGETGPSEGRGVQYEVGLIRDRFYADQPKGLKQILPVVLPGCSGTDIPTWLRPAAATHYKVDDFSQAGAEKLIRVLTDQPWETTPPLGTRRHLPSRDVGSESGVTPPSLHTRVLIRAIVTGEGRLSSSVWLAGTMLARREEPLPAEVIGVWSALRLPALTAGERMATAGLLAGGRHPRRGQPARAGRRAGQDAAGQHR